MQRSLAIAIVLGAVIIAVALVYHGRQLAEISRRLQAMEQRASGLDHQLESFSSELPALVEQAGYNAGRQAVHGMVEEVVQMPANWLKPRLALGASNALKQIEFVSPADGPLANHGTLGIRFDIHKPVVTFKTEVEVATPPSLQDLSALLRPAHVDRPQAVAQTNHKENAKDARKPHSP